MILKVLLSNLTKFFHCATYNEKARSTTPKLRKKIIVGGMHYPVIWIEGLRIERKDKEVLVRLIYHIWDPGKTKKPCQLFLLCGKRVLKSLYNSIPPTEKSNPSLLLTPLNLDFDIEKLSLGVTREKSIEDGIDVIKNGEGYHRIPLFCL